MSDHNTVQKQLPNTQWAPPHISSITAELWLYLAEWCNAASLQDRKRDNRCHATH